MVVRHASEIQEILTKQWHQQLLKMVDISLCLVSASLNAIHEIFEVLEYLSKDFFSK